MNALNRLGADYILSDDQAVIRTAEKVIFPGVGHAGAAMESLKVKGLIEVIRNLNQPVLGICVGMQLLCSFSEEGSTTGLGVLPMTVKRFSAGIQRKVPHMGWNTVEVQTKDILLDGMIDPSYFYFVHSYYVPLSAFTIASCSYGIEFSAAVRKNNFWGIQFHAEKSSYDGARLLSNFVKSPI